MQVSIPTSILSKWADSLYAMGKTAPDEKFADDSLKLARAMYAQRDSQLGDNVIIQAETVQCWMNKLLGFSPNKETEKNERAQLLEIYNSVTTFFMKAQVPELGERRRVSFEPEIVWESIILAFTLWYGGQSFSLKENEFDAELALNQNIHLRDALRRLEVRSVFTRRKTGLILIDPRFKGNVDSAMLFLIALGANLSNQLEAKKGYLTIQSGFLQFSRVNHHPLAYLADGVRSYISDYCQRIFGRIFKLTEETGNRIDYSVLRKFVTRLSLYSESDFVISSEKEMELTIQTLESLKAIALTSDRMGRKYILLQGEVANA